MVIISPAQKGFKLDDYVSQNNVSVIDGFDGMHFTFSLYEEYACTDFSFKKLFGGEQFLPTHN